MAAGSYSGISEGRWEGQPSFGESPVTNRFSILPSQQSPASPGHRAGSIAASYMMPAEAPSSNESPGSPNTI